mgnify:CR=1 FL=1
MKVDLNTLTRRFLLGESQNKPTVRAYVESVASILNELRPRSQRENRQLEVARQNLREIKSLTRILENKVTRLEEQVKVLEEGK